MPIKQIASRLGISKNTVKAKLAADVPPRYQRAAVGSAVDEFEPRIRELLKEFPTMPATVIAERIGWTRGMTVLTARVRELRPVYLPPDPASRTAYLAGEIAQNDFWFPDIRLPVGFGQTRTAKQLPVLTMVAAYSRTLFARLIPSRRAEDLYAGWWSHLARLGAVPRTLVWDGEGAVGAYGGGRNKLTAECQAFRGTLGTKVIILRPGDPEAKGIIERAHDYLETSFLPGRVFTGPADFNTQMAGWLGQVNARRRRALGCAPIDRIGADRAAMLPLPPLAPVTGWRASTRLARDYYVRVDGNDYSVHPGVIGRRVSVRADLDRVQAHCEGRLVADHERVWAWHQTITDPEHHAAAKAIQRDQQRQRLRPVPPLQETTVEQRTLADYDTALGINLNPDLGIDLDHDGFGEGGHAS
jgi:transposase